MENRLLQFINSENMSQAQFADRLGVARASISHIISGRNKPGYDFMEALTKHFPALNIEWLITGKGKMYKFSGESSIFPVQQQAQSQIFDSREEETIGEISLFPEESPVEVSVRPQPAPQTPLQQPISQPKEPAPKISKTIQLPDSPQKRIKNVVVLFEDGTFQML